MLPGMYNPMFLGSSALTFSLVNTGTDSDAIISIPSGAAVGDFGILYQYVISDGVPTIGTPSGWTLNKSIVSLGSGAIHSRILTSASGSVDTGSVATGGGEIATCMKIFRPSRPLVSIVPSASWNGEGTNGNPTLQTTDPSAETTAVIIAGISAAQSSTFSLTGTPTWGADSTLDTGTAYSHFVHTIYNTGPLSQTIDMIDEGSFNLLISGYYTFT